MHLERSHKKLLLNPKKKVRKNRTNRKQIDLNPDLLIATLKLIIILNKLIVKQRLL